MVAEAIGLNVTGEESLETLLSSQFGRWPTLLILDHFEQLVDAAPVVGELLARAEQLRVLVTSQVSLRMARKP